MRKDQEQNKKYTIKFDQADQDQILGTKKKLEKYNSKNYYKFHKSHGHTPREFYGFRAYLFSKYQEEGLSQHEDSPPKSHNNTETPKQDREGTYTS
ncbi:hypothetical protein Bca4012_049345 [Brassica carinata]